MPATVWNERIPELTEEYALEGYSKLKHVIPTVAGLSLFLRKHDIRVAKATLEMWRHQAPRPDDADEDPEHAERYAHLAPFYLAVQLMNAQREVITLAGCLTGGWNNRSGGMVLGQLGYKSPATEHVHSGNQDEPVRVIMQAGAESI